MTEPDLQVFKNRIKLIIEEDGNLFDKSKTNQKGKFNKIFIGLPSENDFKNISEDRTLTITNADRTNDDTIRSRIEAGKIEGSDQILRFDLWVIIQKSDSRKAEETSDILWKLLKQRLKSFATLDDPVTPGSPLCDFIELSSTQRIPQMKGQNIDGFRIIMECTLKSTL